MKKYLVVIVLSVLVVCVAFSEDGIKATTEDGKQVILKDDGTWALADQRQASIPLSLAKFDVVKRDKDYDAGRYNEDALLVLTIQNDSDQIVKAYKLTVEVHNAFGDVMHTLHLTSGDSMINPHETEDATYKFDDNPFIDDEVYDSLTSYSVDNLSIVITEAKVVYKQ